MLQKSIVREVSPILLFVAAAPVGMALINETSDILLIVIAILLFISLASFGVVIKFAGEFGNYANVLKEMEAHHHTEVRGKATAGNRKRRLKEIRRLVKEIKSI
ncbi:MAG TPA: hypothetical protein VI933_01465 [archaeon]|nr:hypothetical protein [archaeon]